jgi:hypothetical protein
MGSFSYFGDRKKQKGRILFHLCRDMEQIKLHICNHWSRPLAVPETPVSLVMAADSMVRAYAAKRL